MEFYTKFAKRKTELSKNVQEALNRKKEHKFPGLPETWQLNLHAEIVSYYSIETAFKNAKTGKNLQADVIFCLMIGGINEIYHLSVREFLDKCYGVKTTHNENNYDWKVINKLIGKCIKITYDEERDYVIFDFTEHSGVLQEFNTKSRKKRNLIEINEHVNLDYYLLQTTYNGDEYPIKAVK